MPETPTATNAAAPARLFGRVSRTERFGEFYTSHSGVLQLFRTAERARAAAPPGTPKGGGDGFLTLPDAESLVALLDTHRGIEAVLFPIAPPCAGADTCDTCRVVRQPPGTWSSPASRELLRNEWRRSTAAAGAGAEMAGE